MKWNFREAPDKEKYANKSATKKHTVWKKNEERIYLMNGQPQNTPYLCTQRKYAVSSVSMVNL